MKWKASRSSLQIHGKTFYSKLYFWILMWSNRIISPLTLCDRLILFWFVLFHFWQLYRYSISTLVNTANRNILYGNEFKYFLESVSNIFLFPVQIVVCGVATLVLSVHTHWWKEEIGLFNDNWRGFKCTYLKLLSQ